MAKDKKRGRQRANGEGAVSDRKDVMQPGAVDVGVAVGEPVHPGDGAFWRGDLSRAWLGLDARSRWKDRVGGVLWHGFVSFVEGCGWVDGKREPHDPVVDPTAHAARSSARPP